VRDRAGRPVTAGGVAAAVRVPAEPAPLIYHMNIENLEGDRPDLGWEEIASLVDAIPRTG